MSRSPFELSFDDLVAAGADATASAIEQAERAGVPIAALELADQTVPNVSWSAERVAILKRLWLEGLSAAKIAAHLGGVTRNAVQHKIHRLGWSGNIFDTAGQSGRAFAEGASRGETARIFALSAHTCKWPIGDPSTDGFTFCGRRSVEGPYCVEHARIAYQPTQAKRVAVAANLVLIEPRRRPSA